MLPIKYTERMQALLGDEYDDYLESLKGPMIKALRLNPLKAEKAQLLDLCRKSFGDVFEQVPWEPLGYYYPVDNLIRPGASPLHEAGAYYIQEPSAMKPVTLLDVKPGHRVLDLCAAPGGKSCQIAGYLKGEGLLVCNEPVGKRAKILSRNIERMGIGNALVLNETPERLSEGFAGFFDRVLVDAPCSGEGMFRKNEEEALREWSLDNVRMCAERQAGILEHGAGMLAPGGRLVYSTCTFSHEEDEDLVRDFIKSHPGFILVSMEKLFPHKVRGEGHFMAVLEKEGRGQAVEEDQNVKALKAGKADKARLTKKCGNKGKARDSRLDAYDDFCLEMFAGKLTDEEGYQRRLTFFGDNLYLLPEGAPDLFGLKVERAGLLLGSFKEGGRKEVRFEPSHALALFLRPDMVRKTDEAAAKAVNITIEEAEDYIKGMTLNNLTVYNKGWVLVCVEGLSLGWGKLVNGTLKNHYPKGLRIMG